MKIVVKILSIADGHGNEFYPALGLVTPLMAMSAVYEGPDDARKTNSPSFTGGCRDKGGNHRRFMAQSVFPRGYAWPLCAATKRFTVSNVGSPDTPARCQKYGFRQIFAK